MLYFFLTIGYPQINPSSRKPPKRCRNINPPFWGLLSTINLPRSPIFARFIWCLKKHPTQQSQDTQHRLVDCSEVFHSQVLPAEIPKWEIFFGSDNRSGWWKPRSSPSVYPKNRWQMDVHPPKFMEKSIGFDPSHKVKAHELRVWRLSIWKMWYTQIAQPQIGIGLSFPWLVKGRWFGLWGSQKTLVQWC